VRGIGDVPAEVRTVLLGAFTRAHADRIAGELEKAGIVWWAKQPSFLSRIWEFDTVHLFVDRARLDEARAIQVQVLGADA